VAVESLPLPIGATFSSIPTIPTRAQAERYRAAIAIAAASVFIAGVGTAYVEARAHQLTAVAPTVTVPGPVAVAAPAKAVALAPSAPDAGPLRRNGTGVATNVEAEAVLGPIAEPASHRSTESYRASVSRARSVATQASGASSSDTSSSRSASSISTSSTSSSNSQYLVVRSGDDFGAVAARYGISSDRVATLNPGVDSTQLTIGQSLRVR
jgi:hypothetical protein